MATVSVPEFLRLRPTSSDQTIVERLNRLLDPYECFKTNDVHVKGAVGAFGGTSASSTSGALRERRGCPGSHARFGQQAQHHHVFNNNNYFVGGHKRSNNRKTGSPHAGFATSTPPSKRPPSYERELQSTLNKLTRHNYTKLARAIMSFRNDANLDHLVSSLLEKCYTQTCFLDLFVGLICDLYETADTGTRARINGALALFVTSFIGSENLTTFRIRNHTTDYDGFCDDMLMRTKIVGKHRTILALVKCLLDKDYGKLYLGAMLGALDESMGGIEVRN
jgi:hypothetical protein